MAPGPLHAAFVQLANAWIHVIAGTVHPHPHHSRCRRQPRQHIAGTIRLRPECRHNPIPSGARAVAHPAFVHHADALIHIVANPVCIRIGRTIAAAHPGIGHIAITIAITRWNRKQPQS